MLKLVDEKNNIYQEDFNGYKLVVIPKHGKQLYNRVIVHMLENRQYMVELIPISLTDEIGSIQGLDDAYFKFSTASYGSLKYNEVLRMTREYEKALETAEQFAFSMLELKYRLKEKGD